MRAPLDLQSRITLWHLGVVALCLSIYAATIYVLVDAHVSSDLDVHLGLDVERAVGRLSWDAQAHAVRWTAPSAAAEDLTGGEDVGHWVEVWGRDGQLLLRQGPESVPELGPPPSDQDVGPPVTLVTAAGPVRARVVRLRLSGQSLLLRVGTSEIPERRQLAQVLLGLGILFPVVIVLAALGGLAVTRAALRPLMSMTEQAQRISAERLDERLPVDSSDEVGQLAQAFNATLARLESAFGRMRRFTADASHELRTPLTALRSVGEVGLSGYADSDHLRETIGSMLEETDRLTSLVDTLLELSRVDAGDARLAPEWVPACDLVCEMAGQLAVLAEERRQKVVVDNDAPLCVLVDKAVFRHALVNLLDNAIKYSPAGSTIRLVMRRNAEDDGVFEVHDQGPGIAPEHQARVFDRFYRVDPGRDRIRGGTGLGLALVRAAARSHDGRVELESEPGEGTVFRIVLPAARCRTVAECGCRPMGRSRLQIEGCS